MRNRFVGMAWLRSVKWVLALALTASPALAQQPQPSRHEQQTEAPKIEEHAATEGTAGHDTATPAGTRTGESLQPSDASQSQGGQSGQPSGQQPTPTDQGQQNQQGQGAQQGQQQGQPPQQGQQQGQPSQPGRQPQQAQPPQPGQTAQPGTKGAHEGTSNDRLFFAFPNYLAIENSGQLKPLTPGQKFNAVARGTFDPFELGFYAAVAGIGQADNSERGYGQGAEGYAKRYGATFADSVIENFMVGAVFPSVLHTDPRYYQLGKGGFVHRTEYAISRLFVNRTDSGHRIFNFSEVFGSAVAAGISTYSYHPGNDRTLSNTASVWGTQIGQDAISSMLKEFWPDLRKRFKKH
jgi:hypothetical protein